MIGLCYAFVLPIGILIAMFPSTVLRIYTDNPDLIATVVVGDGEAETGPLATSWQSNKFLNPVTDGAVLPILHLNGYKISNPTIFSRIPHDEIEDFFKGCGWKPYFVEATIQ